MTQTHTVLSSEDAAVRILLTQEAHWSSFLSVRAEAASLLEGLNGKGGGRLCTVSVQEKAVLGSLPHLTASVPQDVISVRRPKQCEERPFSD